MYYTYTVLPSVGYIIEISGVILIKVDIYKTIAPGTCWKKNLKKYLNGNKQSEFSI